MKSDEFIALNNREVDFRFFFASLLVPIPLLTTLSSWNSPPPPPPGGAADGGGSSTKFRKYGRHVRTSDLMPRRKEGRKYRENISSKDASRTAGFAVLVLLPETRKEKEVEGGNPDLGQRVSHMGLSFEMSK